MHRFHTPGSTYPNLFDDSLLGTDMMPGAELDEAAEYVALPELYDVEPFCDPERPRSTAAEIIMCGHFHHSCLIGPKNSYVVDILRVGNS